LKNLVRYCWLLVVCCIDVINTIFLLNQACTKWCSREVKWLLFFVEGSCKSTGNCCESIHISYDYKPIHSLSFFQSILKKDVTMARFSPVFSGHTIRHFDCRCLTEDRRCSDYDSRPVFCQQYPYSVLYSDAVLHQNCGYVIKKRFDLPFFSSVSLKNDMIIFQFNNRISVNNT
tara:strand:- start:2632 stop:3153 length:522 start_codon:yes stop_codon:yes gene_type:complete